MQGGWADACTDACRQHGPNAPKGRVRADQSKCCVCHRPVVGGQGCCLLRRQLHGSPPATVTLLLLVLVLVLLLLLLLLLLLGS